MILRLLMIRHAEAVDPALTQGIDGERYLTETGIAQSRAVAGFLAKHHLIPSYVGSSPLVRAVQTADILASTWGIEGPHRVVLPTLDLNGDNKEMAGEISTSVQESAALVGHEPTISRFVAWLIGNAGVRIHYKKAAIALLDCQLPLQKGCGKLRMLLPPEFLE
ncbi:MAG: histidine phosphatase family protein [Zavarzinella sp.]